MRAKKHFSAKLYYFTAFNIDCVIFRIHYYFKIHGFSSIKKIKGRGGFAPLPVVYIFNNIV